MLLRAILISHVLIFLYVVRLRGDGGADFGGRGRRAGTSVRGTSRPRIEDEFKPHLPRELLRATQGNCGDRPDAKRSKYARGEKRENVSPYPLLHKPTDTAAV